MTINNCQKLVLSQKIMSENRVKDLIIWEGSNYYIKVAKHIFQNEINLFSKKVFCKATFLKLYFRIGVFP